jgi:AcrR family transcriptional regulator
MRDTTTLVTVVLPSEKGYQGVRLRELEAALGVNAGSPHYHIESKQALLFEVIDIVNICKRRRRKRMTDAIDRLGRFVSNYVKSRTS